MNIVHTKRLEKYLVDLRDYISQEILSNYTKLLNKYKQRIPKTWDELIDTASYIINEEKKQGKNNLISYLGHFPEKDEVSICSATEFIYSFRKDVNSNIPSYHSDNAVNAFNKIKEIKEKISSDKNFQLDNDTIESLLQQGKPLFAKYWKTPFNQYYYISPLPGNKEGISSSCIGGYHLIINNNISKEKKVAAGKVIEFFLSKNIQKKYLINNMMNRSARSDIYNDEELCKEIDCELYNSFQYVSRPPELIENYSLEYLKFLNQFLYGNINAKTALTYIENIDSFHQIEYNSTFGYIMESVSILIIFIVLLSSGIMFMENFKFLSKVFSKTFLCIPILGICMTGSYAFLLLGDLTGFKCSLGMVYFFCGSTLILYPLIVLEIIYFPEKNKYTTFAKNHKYLCFIILLLMDLVFYGISLIIVPFRIERLTSSDGIHFKACVNAGGLYRIYFLSIIAYKFIIFSIIILLAFTEWSRKEIKKELKIIFIIIYTNILFTVLFVIIRCLPPFDLYTNMFIRWFLSVAYSITNYIILIPLQIYYELRNPSKKNGNEVNIVKNSEMEKNEINKHVFIRRTDSYISKIIGYHYSMGSQYLEYNSSTKDKNLNFPSSRPDVILYTDIISSSQMTDIME
ncbi:hypothetical protein U3516DRAFT_600900 [Neocallimastix sp. 'constans']